jgi:hypothetical protein
MARLWRALCLWWLFRQAMTGQMLDRNVSGNNLVNWLLQAIFCLTATTTYTPGAGGPSAKLVTPPFLIALMTTVGSNTGNGTEATAGNCPGYTALASGGKTMGSPAFGTPAAGIILGPVAAVSWLATANWTAIAGVEIWDSASTKLRYLFGSLSGGSVTVNNGNTLQFAISSLSFSGASW